MLRVIPLGLVLLYRYCPLTWRILWLAFYYCNCGCFLFLFLYCYGKMQFFIHCNFFCQKYKFTYLLTILQNNSLRRVYTEKNISCFILVWSAIGFNESTIKTPSTLGRIIGPSTETECDAEPINRPSDRKRSNAEVVIL